MRSPRLVFLYALMLVGCTPPGQTLKEPGDTMTIILRSGDQFQAELLSVQWSDSALLCVTRDAPAQFSRGKGVPAVLLISSHAVDVTMVEGYRNDQWFTGVLITEIGPAVLLAIAAASYGASPLPVLVGSLVPAGLSSLFFGITGLPAPTYKGPIAAEALQEMRRYARFAGEFSPDQVRTILESYEQKEITRVEQILDPEKETDKFR